MLPSTQCPLCSQPVDSLVLQLNRELEPHIIRLLQERAAAWQPAQGVCPRCILDAISAARSRRRAESMHRELALPYPVYSNDETALLTTPYRLHAYPQFSGRGVVIAFLDSGFYPHPDLTLPYNRILAHVDATTRIPRHRPNFRRPAATSWHGLMTSAVAAGSGSLSGYAYRGIASDAQLVLVKTGNRRGRRIHEDDIARALNWVILNQHRYNIRVVNLSVGGDIPCTGELSALDELVEEAVARGLVVVCAVGNGGVEQIVPPASAPSAITVGGVDDRNSLERARHQLYHSNFGRGGHQVSKPDLIAPAIWVAAPILPHTGVYNEGAFLWKLLHAPDAELRRLLRTPTAAARFRKETLALPLEGVRQAIRLRMVEQKYIHAHYQHVDGTSMAAPIVSSIVAQMLEANPTLTPAQVKEIFLETAQPLDLFPRARQGQGVVNAAHAVARALRAPGGALAGQPLSPHLDAATVTLRYYDVEASRVALTAAWSDWTRAEPFHRRAPGVWELVLPHPAPGVYPYKFLVERSSQTHPESHHWLGDPENILRVEDGAGGFYSLLEVGAPA